MCGGTLAGCGAVGAVSCRSQAGSMLQVLLLLPQPGLNGSM